MIVPRTFRKLGDAIRRKESPGEPPPVRTPCYYVSLFGGNEREDWCQSVAEAIQSARNDVEIGQAEPLRITKIDEERTILIAQAGLMDQCRLFAPSGSDIPQDVPPEPAQAPSQPVHNPLTDDGGVVRFGKR